MLRQALRAAAPNLKLAHDSALSSSSSYHFGNEVASREAVLVRGSPVLPHPQTCGFCWTWHINWHSPVDASCERLQNL